MHPERFFKEALPELVARAPAAFAARQGSIAFVVPPRGWTVHLGNAERPVTAVPNIEADLVVRLSEEALFQLLSGDLDVDAAIASHQVVADGDCGLLESFGLFLSGGGSGHQLRAL